MRTRVVLAFGLGVTLAGDPLPASPRDRTLDEVRGLFDDAAARGLVRSARKTKLVDARRAKPGEVVVTVIAGEGKETTSKPAQAGDWVVRNRCATTGHEEYLVAAARFGERYRATGKAPGEGGWQEHRPLGKPMRFFVLGKEQGAFFFEAPWGERMAARPGDAIVQDPENPGDTYRVAAASFACTYEVLE